MRVVERAESSLAYQLCVEHFRHEDVGPLQHVPARPHRQLRRAFVDHSYPVAETVLADYLHGTLGHRLECLK